MTMQELNIVRGRDYAVVSVSGDLDRVATARLRAQIASLREAGVVEVRLDLGAVGHCDPGLARTLAWIRIQLRGLGGNLSITGAHPELRTQLDAEGSALRRSPAYQGDHRDRAVTVNISARPETADQP